MAETLNGGAPKWVGVGKISQMTAAADSDYFFFADEFFNFRGGRCYEIGAAGRLFKAYGKIGDIPRIGYVLSQRPVIKNTCDPASHALILHSGAS